MEEIINKLSQAVKSSTTKRNWGVPVVILSAFVLIGVAVYYGGYFKDLFRGAKASVNQTWDFTNAGDFAATSNVTIADGYATVDLVYTLGEVNNISINDIVAVDPLNNHLLGAISEADICAESIDKGQTWTVHYCPSGLPGGDRFERHKFAKLPSGRVVVVGERVSDVNPPVALAAYSDDDGATWSMPFVAEDHLSFESILYYQNQGWLYAGTSMRGILVSTDNGVTFANDGSNGAPVQADLYGALGIIDLTSAVIPGTGTIRIYAASETTMTGGGGAVYYSDNNGANWHLVSLPSFGLGPSLLSLARDQAGYVYVATSSSYIFKTTTAAGNVFERIDVAGLDSAGDIYINSLNEVFLPSSDGTMYRAVDYTSNTGATDFFASNTKVVVPGGTIAIPVMLSVGVNQYVLAVNLQATSNSLVVTANHALQQGLINLAGIPFNKLVSFSEEIAPAGTANMRYRVSYLNGPGTGGIPSGSDWYYWSQGALDWVSVTDILDMTQTNTATEINSHLTTLADDITPPKAFYFEAIFNTAEGSTNLDTVILGYEETPSIEVTTPSAGSIVYTGTKTPITMIINTGGEAADYLKLFYWDTVSWQVIQSNYDYQDTGESISTQVYEWLVPTVANPGNTHFKVKAELYATDDSLITSGESGEFIIGALEVDHFEVVAPVQVPVNQEFILTVTAKNAADEVVVAYNMPTPVTTELGDTYITPNLIGDGTVEGGSWNNGVATSDHFKISSIGTHTIIVQFGSAQGQTGIEVTGIIEPEPDDYVIDIPLEAYKGANFVVYVTAYRLGVVMTNWDGIHGLTIEVTPGPPANFTVGDGIHGIWENGIMKWAECAISTVGYQELAIYAPGVFPRVLLTRDTIRIYGDQPKIASIDPLSGGIAGNEPITITGINFEPGATVIFDGIAATSVVVQSANTITCINPPHAAGGVVVRVTNLDDQFAETNFEYVESTLPTIVSVVPDHGFAGDTVTITVANMDLDSSSQVYFDGILATKTGPSASKAQIEVIAPPHAPGPVEVKVTTTGYANAVKSNGFTYDFPVTTSFTARYRSPAFATAGTIQSLDALTVVASGYGLDVADPGEVTTIEVGFYDLNDQGLAPWFVFNPADNFTDWYASVISQISLADVRGIRFRITMSDDNILTKSGPWAQSITLTYSTETGETPTLILEVTNKSNNGETQTGGNVIYELKLSGTYTGDINLSTPVVTDNPEYLDSAAFATNPINKPDGAAVTTNLTVTVKTWSDTTKPAGPFPYAITFIITADATGITPSPTATTDLTILDITPSNSIMFHLIIPVEDIPSEALPSVFTLNIYPYDTTGLTKDDRIASVSAAPTSQDTATSVIIVDVPVLKTDFPAGVSDYKAYVRSTRHFWTKVDQVAGLTDDKITIDPSTSASYALGFINPLLVGDVVADNFINVVDIGVLFTNWGEGVNLIGDFTNDNFINVVDLNFAFKNWNLAGDSFLD